MWFAGLAPMRPAVPAGGLRSGFHLEPGMTVGLFGGSFNPAHEGHRHVAETARQKLGLDRIIWLVSPQNPLKSKSETAPLAERMARLKLFIGHGDVISDFETRIHATYTLDTLRALKGRYPGVKFVWIMGGDSLAGFHKWRGWAQLMHMVPIAIVSRPGALMKARFSPAAQRFARYRVDERAAHTLPFLKVPAWTYIKGPLHGHSSTALRLKINVKTQNQ
jgi:nicotinate-nucleotide adenylyltransferase